MPSSTAEPAPPVSVSLPVSHPVYVPPADVFQHWLNVHLERFPGQRPALEWLSRNSRLPLSTCGNYRKRYEEQFPDLYALSLQERRVWAACGRRRKESRKTGSRKTGSHAPKS